MANPNKCNQVKISDRLRLVIDTCKFSPTAINVQAMFYEIYNDEDEALFIRYLQRELGKFVRLYFKSSILVVEGSYIKHKGSVPFIDLTIQTPMVCGQLAKKRQWAFDPNGQLIDLFRMMEYKLDQLYDDFDAQREKPVCGTFLFKKKEEDNVDNED